MNEKTITMPCRAKINLSLDVIRRRSDGYHDVELDFCRNRPVGHAHRNAL